METVDNSVKTEKEEKNTDNTLETETKNVHMKVEEKGNKAHTKKITKQKKNEVTISKKEYEELLKTKELADKYLYLYSEFESYKKRITREHEQNRSLWIERVILDFLPVVDNIELALDHLDQHADKEGLKDFVDGLNMIKAQFVKSLNSYNVKLIESLDKPFDPEYHEAMDQQKNETKEAGIVLKEYQKGYLMNNKVIRPARVSVNTK